MTPVFIISITGITGYQGIVVEKIIEITKVKAKSFVKYWKKNKGKSGMMYSVLSWHSPHFIIYLTFLVFLWEYNLL